MWKLDLSLLVLLLAGAVTLFQEQKEPAQAQKKPPAEAEWKIPPEEAQRANPVKPTSASIADGKNLFSTQCVMCHGAVGDGKGDLAVELKMTLRDYRDPTALKSFTDGELHYILNKGKGQMPGQEGRMKDAQLWNLINFMRSLARTEPPAKAPSK